ncbi:MAG: B12-binding domain-containing radical SAM protein [bacterium]|nr:B12-binding domain-containing radical SAM protein [bacterium]
MDITFIRPNINPVRSADAMHPLAISVLLGLTPGAEDVRVYDECVEDIPFDIETDLVAITAQTFTVRRAYEVADRFRKRGIPVVIGGYHPSFMPDEALLHADAVVIGGAEGVWQQVLEDVKNKRLAKIYRGSHSASLKGLKYCRDHFINKRYNKLFPVEFNRGCRFDCDFCSVSAFHGRTYRWRPIDEVTAEIAGGNARYVLLVDDNVFCDRNMTMEFFKALEPLKIEWGCQISIDMARDEQMLRLMAKSGCAVVMIGLESLNNENLRQMKKGANLKNNDYVDVIEKIRSYGIMIYGSFVFGYDFDTVDVFERTVDFALENNFFLCNFNTLNPMPGTRLYGRLKQEGRLVKEDWWLDKKYQYGEVMFHPLKMTPGELKQGCIDGRTKFYKHSSMFKRLLDFKANCRSFSHLALFLAANVVARKEIIRKTKQISGEV